MIFIFLHGVKNTVSSTTGENIDGTVGFIAAMVWRVSCVLVGAPVECRNLYGPGVTVLPYCTKQSVFYIHWLSKLCAFEWHHQFHWELSVLQNRMTWPHKKDQLKTNILVYQTSNDTKIYMLGKARSLYFNILLQLGMPQFYFQVYCHIVYWVPT